MKHINSLDRAHINANIVIVSVKKFSEKGQFNVDKAQLLW